MNILFRGIFSDSKIGQDFAMSEDKLRYTGNYGLAPYFKGILQKDIESSECFVVSFDDSSNSKNQDCQLDLVIRFFKGNLGKVETRYWHSQFIGHSTVNHILETLLQIFGNIGQC